MTNRKEPLNRDNAEQIQRAVDRQRNKPNVLLSDALYRHEEARRLIFLGLERHYIECATSGRMEDWKRAAHAAVDLLGYVADVEFVRRKDLH